LGLVLLLLCHLRLVLHRRESTCTCII
jgi:hypothetical protein